MNKKQISSVKNIISLVRSKTKSLYDELIVKIILKSICHSFYISISYQNIISKFPSIKKMDNLFQNWWVGKIKVMVHFTDI